MGEAARTPPTGWSGCQSGHSAPCRATCLRQWSPTAPSASSARPPQHLAPQPGTTAPWPAPEVPRRSKAAHQSLQSARPTAFLAPAALVALSTLHSAGQLFIPSAYGVEYNSELRCMCILLRMASCGREGNTMHKWKAVDAPTLTLKNYAGFLAKQSHAAVCRYCQTSPKYVCQ